MESTNRCAFLIRTMVTVLLVTLPAASAFAANSLGRDEDPVVIAGDFLQPFIGADPGSIVAFRYEAGWIQIPVQVDERDWFDFGAPYDTTAFGVGAVMYADTGTFTGPDSDPTLDGDDEIVFMARDAGDGRAPFGAADPVGVVPFTRNELALVDPLDGGTAHVYLFLTDGSLIQGAGADYVGYNFALLSGDYKSTYGLLAGPNPENSGVVTGDYRVHFSDRWIRDELNVTAATATGVDILDRHKNLFGPGDCGRSEDTFSAGEGCFVANIDGPVRAIRSYLGANSGPFTQRVHKFYDRRHDVATYLRVHAVSGVMDFYDYSPAATGMVYYNDLNTGGAVIDGDPSGDTVTAGAIVWEMVTGAQGTLVMAESLFTDIPAFAWTLYYSDDSTPAVTQCTGDAYEYGASGPWVNQAIPNTDPSLGAHYAFVMSRVVYFEGPGQAVARAEALVAQANTPVILGIPVAVRDGRPAPPAALMQNSPNPFGDRTTIRFSGVPGTVPVVEIFDVSGRRVATVTGAPGADGYYAAEWDGSDHHGIRVSSGVYFYRIASGAPTPLRKMVLLR